MGIVAAILLGVVGVMMMAAVVGVMIRIDRANQRKVDRKRAEWEAGGREEPWALGNWSSCSGSGGS